MRGRTGDKKGEKKSGDMGSKSIPPSVIGEAEESLTFFAISDFGSVNDKIRRVAEAMDRYATTVQRPSFVLGLGDNFYPSGVSSVRDRQFDTEWREVYLQYDSLCVPWRIVLGNHDYFGNPAAQVDYTYDRNFNPDGLWQMPARNYTFTCRLGASRDTLSDRLSADGITSKDVMEGSAVRVQLYALDTNGADGEVDSAGDLHAQIASMQKQLSESDADWKIVFGHHCMYTKGSFHGATGMKLRDKTFKWSPRGTPQSGFGLEDALVESGVDAYFCGHEHVFQHTERRGLHHFMCGASGAEQRGATGLLGAAKLPNIDWIASGYDYGFVVCTITSSCMTVRYVNQLCVVIKEVCIRRNATKEAAVRPSGDSGQSKAANKAATVPSETVVGPEEQKMS